MRNLKRVILCAAVAFGVSAMPASAQGPYKNAVSANPFGLLLELFNAEYERVVSDAGTVGFGGSFADDDGFDYVNADVFFRYYPQGTPLQGWSFGGKVGLTAPGEGEGPYFGYGFDVNRSWLLGRNNNFYVGVGFGLKRLVGVEDSEDDIAFNTKFIPTFRIVNVGFAF